jgi:U3 small nucleolar RNA-associated protein 13
MLWYVYQYLILHRLSIKMFISGLQERNPELHLLKKTHRPCYVTGHIQTKVQESMFSNLNLVANSVLFGIISEENVFIFQRMESQESSILRLHFGARGQQIVSAASDGLIKLWTLKSSDGTATMDAHQRALAVKGDDSALVRQGLLLDTLSLAVELDQPFRALNIFKKLTDQSSANGKIPDDMEIRVTSLSTNHQDSLLKYASAWNTNSRHCHQAQLVMNIILQNPEILLAEIQATGQLEPMETDGTIQSLNKEICCLWPGFIDMSSLQFCFIEEQFPYLHL